MRLARAWETAAHSLALAVAPGKIAHQGVFLHVIYLHVTFVHVMDLSTVMLWRHVRAWNAPNLHYVSTILARGPPLAMFRLLEVTSQTKAPIRGPTIQCIACGSCQINSAVRPF